jgi:hypothetical protein
MQQQVLSILSVALLVAAAACVVLALIVRAATRWVAAIDVPYLRVYLTLFLCLGISLAVGVSLHTMLGMGGLSEQTQWLAQLAVLPVLVILSTIILSRRLEVSFGQGIVILLVVGVICGLVGLAALGGLAIYHHR